MTHIVLINLLFDSFAAYAAAAKEVQGPDISNVSLRTEEILDLVPPVDIANCDVSCRVAAIELGISVTTVVKRRRVLGLPIAERRKTLTPDRLAIVRKRLATGVSPAQVAQEAHVSLSSVYRIRSETAGLASPPMKVSDEEVVAYRKRWVSTGLLASSVRQRRVLDGAAYAWLYRHDRDWLTANRGRSALPVGRKLRRSRIDWDKRDENYARRIAALSADQRERSPRKRVSASALLRETGAQTSIRAHLYRLPKTRAALRTYSESVGSFQKLRYAQAGEMLLDSDGFFPQWKALKLAGLRKVPPGNEVGPEGKE